MGFNGVSISIAIALSIATAAIVAGVVGFVPTFQTGVESVRDSVSVLRNTAIGRVDNGLREYFRGPAMVAQTITSLSDAGYSPDSGGADAIYPRICRNLRDLRGIVTRVSTVTTTNYASHTCDVQFGLMAAGKAEGTGLRTIRGSQYNETTLQNFTDPRVRVWKADFNNSEFFDVGRSVDKSRRWTPASGGWIGVTFRAVAHFTDVGGQPGWVIFEITVERIAALLETLGLTQGSRVAMLDGSNGIVFGNNWGAPNIIPLVVPGTNIILPVEQRMILRQLEDFGEPLIQRVLSDIGGSAAIRRVAGRLSVTVGTGEDRVYVDVVSIQDTFGINVRALIAIPENDFLGKTFDQERRTIGGLCGAIVGILLIGGFFSVALTRPLKQLAYRMERTATLQDDKEDEDLSFLSEVRAMQVSYRAMRSNLTALKRFVPQGLFARPTEQVEDSGTTLLIPEDSVELSHVYSSSREDQVVHLGGDVDDSDDATVTEDAPSNLASTLNSMRFASISGVSLTVENTGLDSDRLFCATNDLRWTDCVTLVVQYTLPEFEDSDFVEQLNKFQETVAAEVQAAGGVLEQLRPARVFVSFGARGKIANPAEAARHVAFRISKLLNASSSLPRFRCAVVLDRGRYLVGAVGSAVSAVTVLHGEEMDTLFALTQLAFERLGVPIVATERIASSLAAKSTKIPIDCVEWGFRGAKSAVLYALEEKDAHGQSIVPQLRAAFGSMRKANFSEATTKLRHALGKCKHHTTTIGITMIRLLSIANSAVQEKRATSLPYLRAGVDWGNVDGEELIFGGGRNTTSPSASAHSSKGGQTSITKAVSALDTIKERAVPTFANGNGSHNSFPSDSCEGTSPHDIPPGTPETGLFEMAIMNASTTSSDNGAGEQSATENSMSAADGTLRGGVTELRIGNSTWIRGSNKLGNGAFGDVHRVLNGTGALAALKTVPLLSRHVEISNLQQELVTASSLRHENIVGYVDTQITETHMMLLMELVSGGSLDGVLRDFGQALPLHVVRKFTVDILRGLVHMHSNGITHCDIKPQNVLISVEGVCKLADFGSCVHQIREGDDRRGPETNGAEFGELDVRGTPLYMAPEVASGSLPNPASDVWSLGMVVHELITGRLPWNAAQLAIGGGPRFISVLTKLRAGAPAGSSQAPPEIAIIGDNDLCEAQIFVAGCLQLNPAARPTAEALLSSPFLL